ncbi:MAG: DUF58 domain-containing protein, partial [Pseudomonadota bacterium]
MISALSRARAWLGQAQPKAIDKSRAEVDDGVHLQLDELIKLRFSAQRRAAQKRRRVRTVHQADQRSRALGRGLDFAEVRTYLPGDDVRLIDWNVTARTNVVHTKLFEEEKERPVFMVVDLSRSMRFGTRPPPERLGRASRGANRRPRRRRDFG